MATNLPTSAGYGYVTLTSKFAWRRRCAGCGEVQRLSRHHWVSPCPNCGAFFSRKQQSWGDAKREWVLGRPLWADVMAEEVKKPLFFTSDHRRLPRGRFRVRVN